MLKIAQVGGALKSSDIEDIEFSQKLNFSDFDIIFIDMQYLIESLSDEIDDASVSNPSALSDILESSIEQMADFYKHGGISITFFSEEPYSLKEISEGYAGKDVDVFSFMHLNAKSFTFQEIEGSAFEFLEQLEFLDEKFHLRYKYIFKAYEGEPVLRSKKKKDVVGIKKIIGKGVSYLIPSFDEACKINGEAAYLNFQIGLEKIQAIPKLKSIEGQSIPEWAKNHLIYDEVKYVKTAQSLFKEKACLETLIHENQSNLQKFISLKALLYAGDETLESIVEEVFRKLGFNVQVPAGNQDDLQIHEPEFTAVVEIKGLTKSGSTMNVMQLEKWVSNYGIEHEGEIAKGILILNPFRDRAPSERKENPFPSDMLNFSKARGHCLLLSEDLLNIYVDFQEGLIEKQDIISLLFKTTGVVKYRSRYNTK